MTKGRGWHGDPERHSKAARGIKTTPTRLDFSHPVTSPRDIKMVEMASAKMDRILTWLDLNDRWRIRTTISVREQDKLTKRLDDIIETLDTVRLSGWMDEEVGNAKKELEIAWSSKLERDRILSLEIARERLHNVITSYLRGGVDFGLPGPPVERYYMPPQEWDS